MHGSCPTCAHTCVCIAHTQKELQSLKVKQNMCPSQEAAGLASRQPRQCFLTHSCWCSRAVRSTLGLLRVHVDRCRHPLHGTACLACLSFFLWAPETHVFPSCQGQAVPPLLAPSEAQKVLFLLTLCVLWLELLTPSSMESRPRREASCPGGGAEGS